VYGCGRLTAEAKSCRSFHRGSACWGAGSHGHHGQPQPISVSVSWHYNVTSTARPMNVLGRGPRGCVRRCATHLPLAKYGHPSGVGGNARRYPYPLHHLRFLARCSIFGARLGEPGLHPVFAMTPKLLQIHLQSTPAFVIHPPNVRNPKILMRTLSGTPNSRQWTNGSCPLRRKAL